MTLTSQRTKQYNKHKYDYTVNNAAVYPKATMFFLKHRGTNSKHNGAQKKKKDFFWQKLINKKISSGMCSLGFIDEFSAYLVAISSIWPCCITELLWFWGCCF